MNLVSFAARNLLRRPARTGLSVLGIALAVGAAVALLALGGGITRSVDQAFDERGATLAILQRGASDVFGGFLAEDLQGRIGAAPGVAGVTGELIAFTTSEARRHVLVVGWSSGSFAWAHLPLRAGRPPRPDETRSVVLGDTVADALGKSVGDTVELFDETFVIVGISAYRSVMNRGLAIMPLAVLQELTFRPRQVTGFSVRLAPSLRGREPVERLKLELGRLGPVVVSETRDIMADDRNVRVLDAIASVISTIALALGVLGVLNTMLITVQERTREIGILAAIGWAPAGLMGLVLLEGVLLGLAGCVGGVILGVASTRFFGLVPAVGSYISFTPEAPQVAAVAGAALVLSLVGGLYPAWRAIRIEPLQALRHM
jgi:putative ABC transport system permease protein